MRLPRVSEVRGDDVTLAILIVALLILALEVVTVVRDVRFHHSIRTWVVLGAVNPAKAKAMLLAELKKQETENE